MKRLAVLFLMFGLLMGLAPAGCRHKEKSKIEIETKDSKHKIELEKTDKND